MGSVSPELKTQTFGNIQRSNFAPIVLLHGWGSDSKLWDALTSCLHPKYPRVLIDLPGFGVNAACEAQSLDELYKAIIAHIPAPCHLIGWSLGGMIAAQLCARYPDLFLSLTSIACNAKFSNSADWNFGCEQKIFSDFYAAFSQGDHEATLARFLQLQSQGDGQRKKLVKLFRENHTTLDAHQKRQYTRALGWLNDIDNREVLASLAIPHLAILGDNDRLVPACLKDQFIRNRYVSRCVVLDNCAHAPHISQAEAVAKEIQNFYQNIGNNLHQTQGYERSKASVAKSFSAAACRYDTRALLQKKVAQQLLTYLESTEGLICDLGCGTGFCLESLIEQGSDVIGLDLAHGMLTHCQIKLRRGQEHMPLVCGDFEYLPFSEGIFAGLCSSMSFQWSENIQQVFDELRRVIKPGGWLLFATLGPETLNELRSAWQSVDNYVHINRFESKQSVELALSNSGFSIQTFCTEFYQTEYNSVRELMRDLKDIGAHNVNSGQNVGLTTLRQIKQLEEAYERYRCEDKLPSTYEVYYFLARAN